jgi:hypothetical protein
MTLRLKDLKVKSFVTAHETTAAIKGGRIGQIGEKTIPFTQIPCSAIDACPTAWICPSEPICAV